MPPPKGDLTATKAILGMFLDGPSTTKNIKARLRREHPHGAWSTSIVNTTIPALVKQKLIMCVFEGSKPAEHCYEITKKGIDEFRAWMAEASRAPPPLRDPFLVWIGNSTEDELPLLIATARQHEETAQVAFDKAQERLNIERERGNLGPADGSDYNGLIRNAILSQRVEDWNSRVELAKHLRLNLTQGHDKHRRAEDSGDG
jgi:DNA-binding PadR family transcriptional regulator